MLITDDWGVETPLFLTKKIMNNYKCIECGTKYSTPADRPPPPINWDDGHKCELEKIED